MTTPLHGVPTAGSPAALDVTDKDVSIGSAGPIELGRGCDDHFSEG
jgi:hypothetical protein